MSLFGWIRRGRGDRDDRTSLVADPHWHVDGADFYRVFAALPALVPDGSLLGLVGCAWPRSPRDVRDFLGTWSTQPEPSALASVPRDFVHATFLPIDPRTMSSLTDFANCHAEPELAVHLIAIRGSASLVEWYDLPEDPIAVAFSVAETAVERFATAVGGRYEMSKAGV